MKKKYPQSHETHIRDKLSKRNLDAFFPEHWKINRPEDIESGIEYGVDWLVQITDNDNQLPGLMFCVQSKSTEQKHSKRRIGAGFKVTTLNYLDSLPLPVLIHIYHIPTDTGYWMWLEPYYAEHYTPKWEQKDEVKVYIPTRNILDKATASQIKAKVEKHHRVHYLQEKAQIQTQIDPNFNWDFAQNEKGIYISARPKHDKAFEENPIIINMTLSKENHEALQTSIETGEEAKLTGLFQFEGFPEWFIEPTEHQFKLVARPLVPETHTPFTIDFVGSNDRILWSIRFVELRVVQSGTHILKLEGKLPTKPIICSIIFNRRLQSAQLNLSLDWADMPLNPSVVVDFFDILSVVAQSELLQLMNLKFDQLIRLPGPINFSQTLDADIEETRQLALALATINLKLGKNINIPKSYRQVDLLLAQEVAEILNTGISTKLPDLSSARGTFEVQTKFLPAILKDASKDEIMVITFADPQGSMLPKLQLFGEELDLGSVEYVVSVDTIFNRDEIQERVQQDNLAEDETFPIEFSADASKSFTRFPRWKNQEIDPKSSQPL
jgi:hypothetical protein